MPGIVFHLNARTQGGQPRFGPSVRSRIRELIGQAVGASDARLLAYAVMSNHLHVVLQQGRWSLGRVMQPLLRRVALLMHSLEGTQGHVFERPFHDRACLDPHHVRNAIVYVHLNPVRAGIADHPADYPWSSHGLYDDPSAESQVPVDTTTGLRLFAPHPDATPAELILGYQRYLDWRLERDRFLADAAGRDVESLQELAEFRVIGPWGRVYAPLFPTRPPGSGAVGAGREAPERDLRDIAIRAFAMSNPEPGLNLDQVRSGCRLAELVRVRRRMVWLMAQAGYRGCDIARYMRVSDQCVSAILVRVRRDGGPPT
jgi:REP element-mobilizing transposase RayT